VLRLAAYHRCDAQLEFLNGFDSALLIHYLTPAALVKTIVPNCSAFRKRNRAGPESARLRLFEIARVFVRFHHVARTHRKRESQRRVSGFFAFSRPAITESTGSAAADSFQVLRKNLV
jgi:hypothetical protein